MSRQIYGLHDPRVTPRKIRYVGYSGVSVARRLASHILEAKKGCIGHRSNWIRKLLAEGCAPELVILETVRARDWQQREQFWIKKFGHQLTNATAGGEGLINPSIDVRQRISKKVSALLIGNSRHKGISHSTEAKKRISAGLLASEKAKIAAIGRKFSSLAHNRARAANLGCKRSRETRRKLSAAHLGIPKVSGYTWANDGAQERLIPPTEKFPPGFFKGRLASTMVRCNTR